MPLKDGREAVLRDPIRLGRDVRHRAALLDLPAEGITVIALVRVQDFAGRKALQGGRYRRAISDLAASEPKGKWAAVLIGQGVDLGRAPATRTTDRLSFLPPFPPEAERCAFTADESIRTWTGGPPALARVWKRLDQTPFSAHRT